MIEKLELVKKWTNDKLPRFPQPEYQIGDIVRYTNDDDETLYMVIGIRLEWFGFMRKHIWYYQLGNNTTSPMLTDKDWQDAEEIEHATPLTEDDRWYTKGPLPKMSLVKCGNCNRDRIDDMLDCPHCGAEDAPI